MLGLPLSSEAMMACYGATVGSMFLYIYVLPSSEQTLCSSSPFLHLRLQLCLQDYCHSPVYCLCPHYFKPLDHHSRPHTARNLQYSFIANIYIPQSTLLAPVHLSKLPLTWSQLGEFADHLLTYRYPSFELHVCIYISHSSQRDICLSP